MDDTVGVQVPDSTRYLPEIIACLILMEELFGSDLFEQAAIGG